MIYGFEPSWEACYWLADCTVMYYVSSDLIHADELVLVVEISPRMAQVKESFFFDKMS